jgi:hypothetical protein
MAEGGKGEQSPEVALHQRQTGSVENADDGEGDQIRRERAGLNREEADVEAQHGIEAELAGDDHGEGDRSFRVGVGEPAVQREEGNLDGEGEEESKGSPARAAGWERPLAMRICRV